MLDLSTGRASGAVSSTGGCSGTAVGDLSRQPQVMTNLAHDVGLALRTHRRSLGLSQRGWATQLGRSAAQVARLEAHADQCRLDVVVDVLEITPWVLCLGSCVLSPDEHGRDWLSTRALPPRLSRSTAARLRRDPGARKLGLVAAAAHGHLVLLDRTTKCPPSWADGDVRPRVEGGGRRFAGHRYVVVSSTEEWYSLATGHDVRRWRSWKIRVERAWRRRLAAEAARALPRPRGPSLDDVADWDDFDVLDERDRAALTEGDEAAG